MYNIYICVCVCIALIHGIETALHLYDICIRIGRYVCMLMYTSVCVTSHACTELPSFDTLLDGVYFKSQQLQKQGHVGFKNDTHYIWCYSTCGRFEERTWENQRSNIAADGLEAKDLGRVNHSSCWAPHQTTAGFTIDQSGG